MAKDLIIRSTSAEFLIFERQTHDNGIQVRFENGDLWLTQKAIAELYDVDRTVKTKHLKNIYKELDKGATSVDYDKKAPTTIKSYKNVQNKMHYAVSYQTAAEIIFNIANSEKEYMGLTNWKNSPDGKILETDVAIVKNCLSKKELNDLDILKDAGKISHEIACDKALTEFEKYRIMQDKLYKSDFDLLMKETNNKLRK